MGEGRFITEGGEFVMEEMDMREEYDIKALNPRKNPYAKKDQETCHDEYECHNDRIFQINV